MQIIMQKFSSYGDVSGKFMLTERVRILPEFYPVEVSCNGPKMFVKQNNYIKPSNKLLMKILEEVSFLRCENTRSFKGDTQL